MFIRGSTSPLSAAAAAAAAGALLILPAPFEHGHETVHAVVAQADIGTVQPQMGEPRPCLQCGPVRYNVVPRIDVDVGAEVAGIVVTLPMPA